MIDENNSHFNAPAETSQEKIDIQKNTFSNITIKSDPSVNHNIDPVANMRKLQGEIEDKMALFKASQPKENAPVPGLSTDEVNSIIQGNPAPGMPQNPSEISPVKDMTLGELQQFCLALEAKISHLESRFNTLARENFRVEY